VKLELTQNTALGRLELTMTENCHGDGTPVLRNVTFNRFYEKMSTDTAALAAAIIAARWCGEFLEFVNLKLSPDFAEAVQAVVEDARFVQPIDGYRRNLCNGRLDVLAAPAADAAHVLACPPREGGTTRLVTWNGEFVDQHARHSSNHMAGEFTTNANVLIPDWEVSVCLGLLIGGLSLRSITAPQPGPGEAEAHARMARALYIIGVQLVTAEMATPAPDQPPARPARSRGGTHRTARAAETVA
jgi:hypothetical protein